MENFLDNKIKLKKNFRTHKISFRLLEKLFAIQIDPCQMSLWTENFFLLFGKPNFLWEFEIRKQIESFVCLWKVMENIFFCLLTEMENSIWWHILNFGNDFSFDKRNLRNRIFTFWRKIVEFKSEKWLILVENVFLLNFCISFVEKGAQRKFCLLQA